jgi:hypothetical protein
MKRLNIALGDKDLFWLNELALYKPFRNSCAQVSTTDNGYFLFMII